MTCKSITISGKDHHDKITAKKLRSPLYPYGKRRPHPCKIPLPGATRACHARGSSNLNLKTNFIILGIL
jgi:hypothetical protein